MLLLHVTYRYQELLLINNDIKSRVKAMFSRGSHVRVGIQTGVGDKLTTVI